MGDFLGDVRPVGVLGAPWPSARAPGLEDGGSAPSSRAPRGRADSRRWAEWTPAIAPPMPPLLPLQQPGAGLRGVDQDACPLVARRSGPWRLGRRSGAHGGEARSIPGSPMQLRAQGLPGPRSSMLSLCPQLPPSHGTPSPRHLAALPGRLSGCRLHGVPVCSFSVSNGQNHILVSPVRVEGARRLCRSRGSRPCCAKGAPSRGHSWGQGHPSRQAGTGTSFASAKSTVSFS